MISERRIHHRLDPRQYRPVRQAAPADELPLNPPRPLWVALDQPARIDAIRALCIAGLTTIEIAAELGTEPPPTVLRSAFDRLGCARGDVLAMHAAVLAGERLDPVRFAERAREIQQVLVQTDRLLRGQRDEIIRLP